MTTNQEGKQTSFRTIAGTDETYNGDSLAAYIAEGGTGTEYSGAFHSWLQTRTGSSETNINSLMALFASQQSFGRWDQINTIPADGGISWYDAVVDVGGGGDYTTLAAAEAGETAPFVIYVKSGTYAGTTLAKAAEWVFEPATIIDTTTLTVSGNNTAVILGSGCDVQVLYTPTGTDHYCELRNGVTMSSGLQFGTTADRGTVSGGGWGSVVSGASLLVSTCDDMIMSNIHSSTGVSIALRNSSGQRNNWSGCKATSTGNNIKYTENSGDELSLGNYYSTGKWGYLGAADRHRGIGDNVTTTQAVNRMTASTDDAVFIANIVNSSSTSSIGGGTDCLVVGNRLDPAPSIAGTTDANDTTAF